MSLLNSVKSSIFALNKETLGPAFAEAGKALDSFGSNQLGPALAGAAVGLDAFGKEKLGPVMEKMRDFVKESAGPAMKKTGEYAGEGMKMAGEYVKENARPAMNNTGSYIKQHPIKATLLVASAASLLAPGAVAAPVLWGFGWGGAGVRAHSVAAAIHASIGNVAAGSAFATFQSAGVVGSAAVNGVVQAAGVVTGLVGLRNSTGNGTAYKGFSLAKMFLRGPKN